MITGRRNGASISPSSRRNPSRVAVRCAHQRSPPAMMNGAKQTTSTAARSTVAAKIRSGRRARIFTVPSFSRKRPGRKARDRLVLRRAILKRQPHRTLGVDALVELRLQRRLRFTENSAFSRLLSREFGQRRQLRFDIGSRNPVPKTVFEREHVDLLLFHAENRRVR